MSGIAGVSRLSLVWRRVAIWRIVKSAKVGVQTFHLSLKILNGGVHRPKLAMVLPSEQAKRRSMFEGRTLSL